MNGNTGKKRSKEYRLKLSLAHKGQVPWNAGKSGTYHHNKKRAFIPHSEERKAAFSIRAKELGFGNWMKDKIGSKNNCWRGGVSTLAHSIRNINESNEWKKSVFQRDNYTCQDCGVRGCKLEAHHNNKPFAQIMSEFLKEYKQFSIIEDRETLTRIALSYKDFWDIDNGKTLCLECHNLTKKGVYERPTQSS